MFIFYDPITSDVKMISEGLITTEINYIKKDLTDQDKIDLADPQNKRQVIDGKLVITKPIDDYNTLISKINTSKTSKDTQDVLVILTNKFYNKSI